MRYILLVLIFALIFGASVPPTLAADNCLLSFQVQLAPDKATSGRIAGTFSTLRSAPGAINGVVVLAPAQFTVLGQRCVGGLSWVQIRYTSGVSNTGAQATALGPGWALESQNFADTLFGAGYWLRPSIGNQGGGTTPPPASNSCSLSYPTAFTTSGAATGKIASSFSTLRPVAGAVTGLRVLSPATFNVLSQRCIDGYSWVQLAYTSGVTETGGQATALGPGWALESQIDPGSYGSGHWLVP